MCRIETDEGIVGWGEGTNFPKVEPIATEIEVNKSSVIGQSAWDIEKIWYTLYRGRNTMHGSSVQSPISAIDSPCGTFSGRSSTCRSTDCSAGRSTTN
jgi:galactonate dehydratase